MTEWQKELSGNFKRHGVLPVTGSFGVESVKGGKYHPLSSGECCVIGAALIGHECRHSDAFAVDFGLVHNKTIEYTVGLVAGWDDRGSGDVRTDIYDYEVGFRDGVAVRSWQVGLISGAGVKS